ncbi:MAG: 4-hydroxy-tetrahydrodipicolinate synthase [Flavobacteriaceae bacterium CG2_30_34_30]|nr:MAG: 4-hydroxy-tetrahydrodipicolinate synthase [Flavobacteriaceae bacterium CG2_30_34_30]PIQ17102.1 MAG: 4-hydroxy-tetrahydrodipicolinate synthase [Flavobacteriaceae bacterium CG18_big_fil_WC_8_21_14_2_50_34_36]PIV48919.1 MAG: 4-hydroxy-tetrahydrodipicolinate synthase [Flavobacteriaceae bacterium CG02_land_8_20_14_3_00_34_13]PIZ07949.1 MAG: 4-hydroxy-tetrahydrodipicolinate synthase [Flavobacteriaceae bacterium CG_4_10_14_0_8_um_filter_34_31]PJC06567.1 MAG: 4-hydroxy-tetrahydrodipicolinate sy
MKQLIGTGVALVTPFKTDFSIDIEALKRVVNHCIEGGIDYLVVLGTTGESATLSSKEKQQVIDTVVSANNSRLPLVLGIGGNNTQKVVEEILTRDLSAFDAILSVSPYYNKPTQEGIYQHFKAIAKASPKPIIMYNVPGRTSSNMLPKTVIRLANDFKNIVGIKEAAGDIVQGMRLIKDKPKDFHIISGDDMITLPMVLAGGSGVISVIGQGFPKEFSTMVNLGLERKVDAAYALHYNIAPSIDMIFAEGNPAGIKAVFNELGICNATVRLPLVSATDALRQEIKSFISQFK